MAAGFVADRVTVAVIRCVDIDAIIISTGSYVTIRREMAALISFRTRLSLLHRTLPHTTDRMDEY